MAGLFQVLWGAEGGVFQAAQELIGTDGEPLIIPEGEDVRQNGGVSLENICTRPFAVDWDADGDLDLVVGNFGGTFYVFWGEGEGRFQPQAEMLRAGGAPLKLDGHHSDPFVVDFDADGDLDIVSGSSQGGAYWAQNVAGPDKSPELSAFKPLIQAPTPADFGRTLKENELAGPYSSTRVWVDDVNGDGKLDLLVGDMVQLTSPAVGLSEEEFQEKYAAWTKEVEAAATEYTAAVNEVENEDADDEHEVEDDEDAEQTTLGRLWGSLFGSGQTANESRLERAQRRYSEAYNKRSEFMTSEMTGYVWLYLQQ